MKSTNSFSVTSYSLVDVYRCFREMYCLHLQDRIVIKTINLQETSSWKQFTCSLILAYCLFGSLVDPEDGGSILL
jgi:hypothetical protein